MLITSIQLIVIGLSSCFSISFYLLLAIDNCLYNIDCPKSERNKSEFMQFRYDYHSVENKCSSLDYKKCCQLMTRKLDLFLDLARLQELTKV